MICMTCTYTFAISILTVYMYGLLYKGSNFLQCRALYFCRLRAVRRYNARLVRQIQGMAAVPKGYS